MVRGVGRGQATPFPTTDAEDKKPTTVEKAKGIPLAATVRLEGNPCLVVEQPCLQAGFLLRSDPFRVYNFVCHIPCVKSKAAKRDGVSVVAVRLISGRYSHFKALRRQLEASGLIGTDTVACFPTLFWDHFRDMIHDEENVTRRAYGLCRWLQSVLSSPGLHEQFDDFCVLARSTLRSFVRLPMEEIAAGKLAAVALLDLDHATDDPNPKVSPRCDRPTSPPTRILATRVGTV